MGQQLSVICGGERQCGPFIIYVPSGFSNTAREGAGVEEDEDQPLGVDEGKPELEEDNNTPPKSINNNNNNNENQLKPRKFEPINVDYVFDTPRFQNKKKPLATEDLIASLDDMTENNAKIQHHRRLSGMMNIGGEQDSMQGESVLTNPSSIKTTPGDISANNSDSINNNDNELDANNITNVRLPRCSECDLEAKDFNDRFCESCGGEIRLASYCSECGIVLPKDSLKCTECGHENVVIEDIENEEKKDDQDKDENVEIVKERPKTPPPEEEPPSPPPPENESKVRRNARLRRKVFKELLTTEASYVTSLEALMNVYVTPLKEKVTDETPPLTIAEIQTLFSNISNIYELNKTFLRDIRERFKIYKRVDEIVSDNNDDNNIVNDTQGNNTDGNDTNINDTNGNNTSDNNTKENDNNTTENDNNTTENDNNTTENDNNTNNATEEIVNNLNDNKDNSADSDESITVTPVGDVLLQYAPWFKMYTAYVNNHENAQQFLIQAQNSRKWSTFVSFVENARLDPRCKGNTLESFLIMPIQRIPRYKLLVEQIIKRTDESDPDYQRLQKAYKTMMGTASGINQAMHTQAANATVYELQEQFSGNVELLTPGRKLIHRGQLTIIGKNSDTSFFFFLFSDELLYANKSMNRYNLQFRVPLDDEFDVQDVTDENQKEIKKIVGVIHPHMFVIYNPFKSFAVYCDSEEEKIKWFTNIEKHLNIQKDLHANRKNKAPIRRHMIIYEQFTASSKCRVCSNDVSRLNRRHCHNCGGIVHSDCSKSRMVIGWQSHIRKEDLRVCVNCRRELMTSYATKKVETNEDKPPVPSRPVRPSSTLIRALGILKISEDRSKENISKATSPPIPSHTKNKISEEINLDVSSPQAEQTTEDVQANNISDDTMNVIETSPKNNVGLQITIDNTEVPQIQEEKVVHNENEVEGEMDKLLKEMGVGQLLNMPEESAFDTSMSVMNEEEVLDVNQIHEITGTQVDNDNDFTYNNEENENNYYENQQEVLSDELNQEQVHNTENAENNEEFASDAVDQELTNLLSQTGMDPSLMDDNMNNMMTYQQDDIGVQSQDFIEEEEQIINDGNIYVEEQDNYNNNNDYVEEQDHYNNDDYVEEQVNNDNNDVGANSTGPMNHPSANIARGSVAKLKNMFDQNGDKALFNKPPPELKKDAKKPPILEEVDSPNDTNPVESDERIPSHDRRNTEPFTYMPPVPQRLPSSPVKSPLTGMVSPPLPPRPRKKP